VVGWVLAILLGMAGLLPQSAQTPKAASFLPSVSISLPPDILSETVQISYFLVGPFGGYGGYAAQRTGVHSYEIPTMVDGKAATEIRMIVYASGCEIQQFVIPLAEHSRGSQEFPCQPVETVKLSGHIVPDALVRDTNAELVVTYMAYWAHGFYGIADGFVTGFHLATVSPDANGMFQVDLPRGAPQVGFSTTIRKIRSRTCFEMRFLPAGLFGFESRLQYSRKPARCQRVTLSGWTRPSGPFQPDQIWRIQTQNSLSMVAILGLVWRLLSTESCCRRTRFSRRRSRRVRSDRRASPRISRRRRNMG
jgi:hypothetical protein